MDAYQRLRKLAERQHSLVSLDQVLAAGLSADQARHLVRTGRWQAPRRGVFRFAGSPATWDQAMMAAILGASRTVYASRLAAGRVLILRLPSPPELEIISFGPARVRLQGVRHHRTDVLSPADTTRVRGIPTTSAARTLHDVSGSLSSTGPEAATSDAVRRGLLRMEQLRETHERLARGPGRRSHLQVRELLARRADDWNPGDSDREVWVMDTLAAASLPLPVQQHRVVVGGRVYYLDHAYPAPVRLGVEFDGWAAHGSGEAFHADRARWRRLGTAGWRIVWVTSRTTEAELVADVAAHLELCGHPDFTRRAS